MSLLESELQMLEDFSRDPAAFESLISRLMSPDNEQRSQAESLFRICQVVDPDFLALKLTHLLDSPHPELRTAAAVLLRVHLTPDGAEDGSRVSSRMSATSKETVKHLVLAAIVREKSSKSLSKKLCDVFSVIAAGLLRENEWPELLPFLFQAATSSFPHLQEYSLLIFSRLSQRFSKPLFPHLATLHTVFLASLSQPSLPDVRIAALDASIKVVQCLPSAVEREKFQDLLPAMMLTLDDCLNSGDEAAAQEALKLLIELAGVDRMFLCRQLPDVLGSMLRIAEADVLEESTRHLSVELLVTLAGVRDRAPRMMRKLPQFIGRLVAVVMKMLLDIYDDPTWHVAETEDEDAGVTDNYRVGQESLYRLSNALGGNAVVPVACELILAYLASPDWQRHHAALITLAQIAEACSMAMIENLEKVVTMALKSSQHPHPRVRWAAINAIGQFSNDLGPTLQVQHHQKVLPILALAMDDFQNPRVQAHATTAVLIFTGKCRPEILTPYLDGFVWKLLVLLQNGKQMVQEGALTALASIANSSQGHRVHQFGWHDCRQG